MVPTTIADLLAARLKTDPGQPLITFYDDRTGERTELSGTTYANWVAKTAGVLVDDLDLEPGDRLVLDLPPHWLGPVFLGAAWLAGMEVLTDPAGVTVDLVVHGPAGSSAPADQRLGCALLPFAVAAREPLPDGAADFGTLWPGQPDVFLGQPAETGSPALDGASQGELLDRIRSAGGPSSERVLSDRNPVEPAGIAGFLELLAGAGSLVLVAHPDPASWPDRARSERVTRELRG